MLGSPLSAHDVDEMPIPLIESICAQHVIHYDILRLTYWMLARVRYISHPDLDNHDRFLTIASHAFNKGYLGHLVVDEWLYLLGQLNTKNPILGKIKSEISYHSVFIAKKK